MPHRRFQTRKRFPARKRIALVAHDSRKQEMLDWVGFNKDLLAEHELYATGSTGTLIKEAHGLSLHCFKSGPLGGDQQIGARISEHEMEIVIFFWDPLAAHPHEPDIHALQRIATVYNIVLACDRSSADFIISSPLMHETYEKVVVDWDAVRRGQVEGMLKNDEGRG